MLNDRWLKANLIFLTPLHEECGGKISFQSIA